MIHLIRKFEINGNEWFVKWVSPENPILIDRTGSWTLGVTDPSQNTVFLSDELSGNLLLRVLLHEMTHVTLWEYRILDSIKLYSKPEYSIEMEELICNVVADYAQHIFFDTYRLLGGKAIFYMPGIIERLVA